MARAVLAVLALSAMGSKAVAEQIFIHTQEQADEFASTIQPGATYELAVRLSLADFRGSFADETATVSGAPQQGLNNPIPEESKYSLHLPNTSQWAISLRWQLGVTRSAGGDIPWEGFDGDGIINDIDLPELNKVRNQFGSEGPLPGDVTWNNVVDIEDLNTVRNNFGDPNWIIWDGSITYSGVLGVDEMPPIGGATAIPEPSALLLAIFGLILQVCLRYPRAWPALAGGNG